MDTVSKVLNYRNSQPIHSAIWSRLHLAMSIFGTEEFRSEDIHNIALSISRIEMFMQCNLIEGKKASERLDVIAEQIRLLIRMSVLSKWAKIIYKHKSGKHTITIEKFLENIFGLQKTGETNMSSSVPENTTVTPELPSSVVTPSNIISSPSIPPLPSSLVNKPKNIINKKTLVQANVKELYMQASKANISPRVEDVLCIKDIFSKLSANDIGRIIKVTNGNEGRKKPRINMTTKGPLRKQIIIFMAKSNAKLVNKSASSNITNINKYLKNTKSVIIADFICLTNDGVIITTNKPANMSDLSIIEKYVKNINNINLDNIDCPRLSKSKSYLKIIGLPHNIENGMLTPEVVEGVLKDLHFFENVILASKPRVIKVFSKSDMVVVWIDL